MAATMTTPSSNRYQNVYPATPSSEKRKLNGFWQRNEWWCNCFPRAKAVLRSVTAETPNNGRRFWACPLRNPDGCGFFLWFEEARLREINLCGEGGSAITPSKLPSFTQTRLTDIGFEILEDRRRSDPGTLRAEEMEGHEEVAKPPQRVTSSQSEAESSSNDKGKGKAAGTGGSSGYEPLTPGASTGVKRKHEASAYDDFDDLSSDEERQLASLTDKSAQKLISVQACTDLNAAEGEDDALASSSRPVARSLFPQARSSKRSKSVSFEEPEPSHSTPSKNKGSQPFPTGNQQTSAPSNMDVPPPTVPSSVMTATQLNDDEDKEDNHDVTEKIMHLLQTQSIEPSVLQSVRSVLAASARRTKGIALGRDFARASLNEKKAKIAKQQERIAMLENKEQVLNGQITQIKANLMKMYEDN